MIAAVSDSWIARILLEGGANVDFRDTEGRTALDLAKSAGNAESIEILSEGS
jgi:ankyrin repeat protein